MLSLDDDEIAVALLALDIAFQETERALDSVRTHGPAYQCTVFCGIKINALRVRLRQHQEDVEAEKNDVG